LTPSAAEPTRQAAVGSVVVSVDRDWPPNDVQGAHLSVLVAGRSVPILRFTRLDGPAAILLLVDLTWSVTRGSNPQLDGLAQPRPQQNYPGMFPGLISGLDKAFLPWLGPTDRVKVGSFAGHHLTFSRTAAASSDRLAAFSEAVNPAAAPPDDWFGAAPVWDAVDSAVAQLTDERRPRAIVLVTDGQASGNRVGVEEAVRTAIRHGVAVHVVCAKSWWDPAQYQPADTFVRVLAEETGGLFRADDPFHRLKWDKPARIFGDLVAAVHGSAELQLDVTDVPDGVWPLIVRTSVPDVTVHAPHWLAK